MQLEKAREATDVANIRNAYAVVQAAALTEESTTEITKNNVDEITYTEPTTTAGKVQYQAVITLKQKQGNWQGTAPSIGGMNASGTPSIDLYSKLTQD